MPLRLAVPFAPGGTGNILARFLAPEMSRRLDGRAIVIENQTGAAGKLGAEAVARSALEGSVAPLTDAGALPAAPAL